MCNFWSISLISGVLQVLRQIFTIIIITIIVIVIIIIIIINITTTIRVVFAIPVASSKSERVFSVAGNTVTQKRASLAPEKVENCVIVKLNMNLLREIGFRKYRYLTNI